MPYQRGCCQYKVIYLGGSNPNANSNQRLYGKNKRNSIRLFTNNPRKPDSIGFNIGGQYFTGNNDPFESSCRNLI
jgi:hypothetical protein